MKTNLTKSALIVCVVITLILSACGASMPAAIPTAANTNTPVPPTVTPTITLTPTQTFTPTATLTPTATPNIAATQKYEGFQALVEKLASDKVIPSAEGKYYALDDYSKEFAKIRYYTWDLYDGAKPSNLVIQAKVKISNETTENAFKSGCGFVMQNDINNHAVFFSLDGNANYWADGYDRGSKYLDNTVYEKNPDGVTLTLVLSNKALHFYVNGREALKDITIYGEPFNVGPAVLSGTSQGFGTRCEFTEMALWEVK
jgi:hypothetical protein